MRGKKLRCVPISCEATCSNYEELQKKVRDLTSALEAIAFEGVQFQGDEHNGYYAFVDYARDALELYSQSPAGKIVLK